MLGRKITCIYMHAGNRKSYGLDCLYTSTLATTQSTARVHTSNGQYMVNAQKVRHSTDAIMVKDGPICAQHVETCWLIARVFFAAKESCLIWRSAL